MSITQYSRETGLLFHLFTISEDYANRTMREGASRTTIPLLGQLFAFLELSSPGDAEESALNAHINTIRPKLSQILALGLSINQDLTALRDQEARATRQLQSAEKSSQVLYSQAGHERSFLDLFRGVQTSRVNLTQNTMQSIQKLGTGYEKVLDASKSTARSFEGSLSSFQSLESVLQYHRT